MRFFLIAIVGSSPTKPPEGSIPSGCGSLQHQSFRAVLATNASKPSARDFISSSPFAPAKQKMLKELFDEVWTSVAADFGNHANLIENARVRLAKIICDLAKDDQLGPLQITRTASRLVRQAQREAKQSP